METGIGAFVRQRRTELGLAQNALAERSGLTKGHLSTIEAGKIALPSADIRRRLAKALGVSHLDLLIAAGEITEDEIKAAGAEGVVETLPNDTRSQMHRAVDAVPNWETAQATSIAQGLIWTMQALRVDQTPPDSGTEPMPAPRLANSGQGR